ncbi:MAG: Ni/Fe-hydrogenase cytochrome b subunit [Desulfobulbaceae bacterium]|nr:Ni/Fe-hydrogenase cytochrome b subunit [Desulfobulbaceae bacterium]
MTARKPLGGEVLSKPFKILLAVALVGLLFIGKRFLFGIGSVSGMNDGYPWGIWIALDVVVGTAFACGGYSLAFLIYVFKKGEYSPLLRPALLTSLFGYTLAGFSVLVDLGRYWQAYNIVLPRYSNLHSVMFEVALCIACYVLVLWIEVTPAFLERFNKTELQARLNRVLFFFVAMGLLLPSMHQSSLGTLILMAGYKLSPLWRTGFLPMLFLLSAITMGYAVVIVESCFSSVGFRRPLEKELLEKISSFMPWVLLFYLLVRIEDVNLRGYLPLAFAGDSKGNLFLLENILLGLPMLLLFSPAYRKRRMILFLAAFSIMLGGALYRFNTYITGFDPGNGWHYFPTGPEIMVTFGFLAMELLGYLWLVRKLPILADLSRPARAGG